MQFEVIHHYYCFEPPGGVVVKDLSEFLKTWLKLHMGTGFWGVIGVYSANESTVL